MAKMKTPKIKEVKKHFKNADEIVSLMGRSFKNDNIFRKSRNIGDLSVYAKDGIYEVWSPEQGYAKILSYKEPKEKTYKIKQETGMDSITINDVKYIKEDKDSYKITREQIVEIHKNSSCNSKYDIEQLFPEVFETKLTVGKWYFIERPFSQFMDNQKALIFFEEKEKLYGFTHGGWWTNEYSNPKNDNYKIIEATEQEVTEVLIKEVKKRYKAGDYVEKIHRFSNKYITGNNPGIVVDSDYKVWYGGCVVFKDGQWAEIIPTLTIQEAEAKLNAKIV